MSVIKEILDIKKRRENKAIQAETRARLNLHQANEALRVERERLTAYREWAKEERQRLFEELQAQGDVSQQELMQWDARVAEIKQEALAIEQKIGELETQRDNRTSEYEQAQVYRRKIWKEVIKFEELLKIEQQEARLYTEYLEEKEMEDFRRPDWA